MVQQNIFYCTYLSAGSACINVLAILALAFPEHLRSKKNAKFSSAEETLFYALNIFCQILSGIISTAATWFGPVSVMIPINVAAQLLFNMIFFGSLGIEKFPKDVMVGTCVVATAALLLPYVGPQPQQNQNVVKLFEEFNAECWIIFLTGVTLISGFFCIRWMGEKQQTGVVKHQYKESILMIAKIFSGVLSTSLSKFLVGTSGLGFVITFVGFVWCSLLIAAVSILQATEVDQGKFVPMSAVGTQILNAATGLIIWQDYLSIQSWYCYIMVLIQIVLGVYSIASIDIFSSSADSSYALTQSAKIITALDIAHERHQYLSSFAGGSIKHMINSPLADSTEVLPKKRKLVHSTLSKSRLVRFSSSESLKRIFSYSGRNDPHASYSNRNDSHSSYSNNLRNDDQHASYTRLADYGSITEVSLEDDADYDSIVEKSLETDKADGDVNRR